MFTSITSLKHVADLLAATRDISNDVMSNGRLQIMPAAYYRTTTPQERMALGIRHGLYGLPTAELVDWLRTAIGDRSAIEIGAGSGVLAAALGIPATDNRQQEDPTIAAHTRANGRNPIVYGENVERLDAAAAIAKYKPQVVIASWVTHRFREDRPFAGGSEHGIDEESVIAACEEYVHISNEVVHANKSAWSLAHQKVHADWIFSATLNGSRDFIGRWTRT